MLESNKTGCRFITVDAYFSAVEFYKKNGFQVMRGEDEKKWLKAKEEVEKQIKFNEKHHIETKAKWPEETLSMWFDLTLLTKKESMEF